jgi:cytochrome c
MIRKLTMMTVAIVSALMAFQMTAMAAGGTADEAKALVDKAAHLIASEGSEKAYATFDDPAGGFVDRDLYVFVLNMQGTILAHGANKGLIGKSVIDLKDPDGKAFVQAEISTAQNNANGGWVDYRWPNPVTKKVEAKSSFVMKVGDVFIGVGIYKE